MKISKLEDIVVWQVSRRLARLIYEYTNKEGFSKEFRFRDQIRAAAGSIMDNIAEGFGRGGNKEFINFLCIARGSNEETRSQLYRAIDNGFISSAEFDEAILIVNEISNKINSFISYLKHSELKGVRYFKEDDADYNFKA